MAENKNSIIVYADWINVFEELEDDEAGRLIKHFFRYVNDLNPNPPDRITKIAFEPIRQSLKRDLEKWESKKGERSTSGRMGNLKKYTPDLYLQVSNNQLTLEDAEKIAKYRKVSLSDNSEQKTSQSIANVAVSESVSDNVSDIPLKKENKDNSSIDFEKLKIFWNDSVNGKSISGIEKITDKRKKLIKSLFTEFSKEKFIEVLNIALKSNFLVGDNKSNFVMSFDWFINKNNFIKVMEGNYKNKESEKLISQPRPQLKALELTEEEKYQMRKASGLID